MRAEAFASARVVCLLASLNRSLFANKVRDDGWHGRVEADHVQHAAVVRVGEGQAVGGHAHNDSFAATRTTIFGPLKKSLSTFRLTYIAVQCISWAMKLKLKLEKELVAASSVPLVLSILSEGDSYGYAIIQRVKELSGGKIEWTDGMLYPVLHWLEDQSLVRSRWTKSEAGRRRKYYSLRPEGRQALRKQKDQWTLVSSTLNQLWRLQHA